MSFQEKNITVTLVSFTLIFIYVISRTFNMVQNDSFTQSNVFGLWGAVIFMAIVVTIIGMIFTHAIPVILQARETGEEDIEIDDLKDERDVLIDLRGTQAMYTISSIGGFFAMLTFVLGQSPLVMFTLLILSGVLAQIIGDAFRLYLYRRGF